MVRFSLLVATPNRTRHKRLLGRPDANRFEFRPVEQRGHGENSNGPHCTKIGPSPKKVDRGIDAFIQPRRKLLRRAEEALMKLTTHGFRQIPPALWMRTKHWKHQRHHWQESNENIEHKNCQHLWQWKSKPYHGSRKRQWIPIQGVSLE